MRTESAQSRSSKTGVSDDMRLRTTGETTTAPRQVDFLVYTAAFTLSVFQVEPELKRIEELARQSGGYLSTRDNTHIVIRVPRAKFDGVVRDIEKIGHVIDRNIKAEDVTDEFMDLDTRLRSARAMRERLEKLLHSAAVKDALEIEKELGRITGEIERMEGKLKLLRDKIAYSTITVNFRAIAPDTVRDNFELPFPWLRELGLATLLRL